MSKPAPARRRVFALVPCAGSGARAGTPIAKQYVEVGGRPLVVHTLAALAGVRRFSKILVVVAPEDEHYEKLALPDDPRLALVRCGGETRGETVANGLAKLAGFGALPNDWVLVHDAARCLVRAEWIDAFIDACREDGIGGLLALPVADTLKRAEAGRAVGTLPREDVWQAQTPQMFRFGVVCGGSTLTAQQPFNNVVRVAYQLLASVLGGVQSVFTAAWDEPFAIPTEQSAELALRTQQVLAYETNVPSVVDPLGGSYFIEALTDQVEAEVRAIIDRIETMGGMVAAIEKGMIQREIAQEAYRHQLRIESGAQIIVGVNKFARPEPEREQLELYRADPRIGERQRQKLAEVRSRRDDAKVKKTLASIAEAARGNVNMMPSISDAVKAYASIGEICAVLREHFGTYQEPVAL